MTTDRRRRIAIAVAALLVATAAQAHELAAKPVRELLRIQGYRAPAPAGVKPLREVSVTVLGRTVPLAVTEWRAFAFRDPNTAPTPNEPTAIHLQGERSLLSRIAGARPEQQITLLAERRPGSSDVFVLTVDLCPS